MFHDQADTFSKSIDRTMTPTKAECIAKLKIARRNMGLEEGRKPVSLERASARKPVAASLPPLRPFLPCEGARAVLAATARVSGLREEYLIGRCRRVNYAYWRHIAILLIHRRTDQSSPVIGRMFKRDHSTILHAIDRAEQRAKPEDIAAVEALLVVPVIHASNAHDLEDFLDA